MYGPQVLPAFLPSTGSHTANLVIAAISIGIGALIVVTATIRVIAKRAYKA